MKRICFVTSEIAELGGRQRINALICNELSNIDNYKIYLIFTTQKGLVCKISYPINPRVRIIDDHSLSKDKFVKLVYRVLRQINKKIYPFKNENFLKKVYFPAKEVNEYQKFFCKNEFDTIVAVGPRLSAMLSLLDLDSKKIGWLHTPYELYFNSKGSFQWNQESIYKKLLPKLDQLIVLTDNDVASYKKNMGIQCKRIYNPLTVECKTPQQFSKNRLLFVGRLNYELKGLDLLLDAMMIVVQEKPEIELVIVGDGEGKKRLTEEIVSRHLTVNIVLAGASNHVENFYTTASIMLVPSRKEGFGLVVTEAMEFGIPVIAFKTVGPSEIIQDGINGFLVDNYDVMAFANRIVELCNDEVTRDAMGKNAKVRAKDFKLSNILNEWEIIL